MKQLAGLIIICFIALMGTDWYLRTHVGKRTCDGYPYIFADKDDLKEGKSTFRLWLGSNGGMTCDLSVWFSPTEANRDSNNSAYWSMPQYKIGRPYIHEGSTLLNKDIEVGNYIVEMATANGTVIEHFQIENGMQRVDLKKDNKPLPLPSELQEPLQLFNTFNIVR